MILITFSISANDHFHTSITLLRLGSLVCFYIFNVLIRSSSFALQIFLAFSVPQKQRKLEREGVAQVQGKRKWRKKGEKRFLWRRGFRRCRYHSPGQAPCQAWFLRPLCSLSTRTPKTLQIGNPTERPGTVRGWQYAQWAVTALEGMLLLPFSTPCLQKKTQDSTWDCRLTLSLKLAFAMHWFKNLANYLLLET